jgi:hypothetical protein
MAIHERPRTPNIRKLSPEAENRKRLSPSRARFERRLGVLGLGQDGADAVEVRIGVVDHGRRGCRRDQPPDADGHQHDGGGHRRADGPGHFPVADRLHHRLVGIFGVSEGPPAAQGHPDQGGGGRQQPAGRDLHPRSGPPCAGRPRGTARWPEAWPSGCAVSSQFRPLNIASIAPAARVNSAAHQAASSRARRPNASSSRTSPRMDETKWLISISRPGAKASSSSEAGRLGRRRARGQQHDPGRRGQDRRQGRRDRQGRGPENGADIQIPDRRIPAGSVSGYSL